MSEGIQVTNDDFYINISDKYLEIEFREFQYLSTLKSC